MEKSLSPTSSENHPDTKPWACVACAQKKIKCDRLVPRCSHCVSKDRECEYRAPPPPNRKKRKEPNLEQRMLDRIREYEQTFEQMQIPFEPFDAASPEPQPEVDVPRRPTLAPPTIKREEGEEFGQLWGAGNESQRYYSHGLLVRLAEEFKEGLRIEPEALSEAMSNTENSNAEHHGSTQSANIAYDLCTPAPTLYRKQWIPEGMLLTFVSKLWPVYVDNVHPITMVLHAPSTRSLIDKVTVSSVTSNSTIESLFCAVCACALSSMPKDECESIFATDQELLVSQFQSMAQQKLIQAGFYDFPTHVLLKAYTLLMVSLQGRVGSHTFAVITSIAIRSATSLGIHREGTKLQAPPFEIELRRRLWWYIATIDSRAVELAGLSAQVLPTFDASLPLNINDSDLEPGMKSMPQPRQGATEMIFALARYELVRVQIRISRVRQVGVTFGPGDTKFDTEIDRLEGHLEGNYLRFCDPVIPIHILTTAVLRLGLTKMRLIWRAHLHDGIKITSPEVAKTMRIVEYDNFLHATRQTRRFVWFVSNHFPWGAILQLLDTLSRAYPLAADAVAPAARIWDLCAESLDNHERLLSLDPAKPASAPRPLQLGVIYTAVRAWEFRAAASGEGIECAPRALHEPLRQRAAGQHIAFDRRSSSGQQSRGASVGSPPPGAGASNSRLQPGAANANGAAQADSPLNAELDSLLYAPGGSYDFNFDADVWNSFDLTDGALTTGTDGGAMGGIEPGAGMSAADMGWQLFDVNPQDFNFNTSVGQRL